MADQPTPPGPGDDLSTLGTPPSQPAAPQTPPAAPQTPVAAPTAVNMAQATNFGAVASQPHPGPRPMPPPKAEPPAHHPEKDGEAPADNAPVSHLLRYWAWKYVGSLVMEPNSDGTYVMSLGRVCAAALLGQAMVRWGLEGGDIPQSMLQTLWILLGYNLGTKTVTIAHQWVNAFKGGPDEPIRGPRE